MSTQNQKSDGDKRVKWVDVYDNPENKFFKATANGFILRAVQRIGIEDCWEWSVDGPWWEAIGNKRTESAAKRAALRFARMIATAKK